MPTPKKELTYGDIAAIIMALLAASVAYGQTIGKIDENDRKHTAMYQSLLTQGTEIRELRQELAHTREVNAAIGAKLDQVEKQLDMVLARLR
jgi:hypothetical protein